MATPKVVTGMPELDWFSIDDAIWLSWNAGDLDGEVEESRAMLRGNLLEVHNPASDIGKPHGLGWIDITSGRRHRVESRDPLTLAPSILCAQGCGFHGFVRDGHWVPA